MYKLNAGASNSTSTGQKVPKKKKTKVN